METALHAKAAKVSNAGGGGARGSVWRMACFAGLVVVAGFFLTFGREPLFRFLEQLRQWGPLPFYTVFTVSISFGVPPTPFLLAAGAAFDLPTNLVGISVSYACSLCVAYTYAHRLFKRQLESLLARRAPLIAALLQNSPVATTLLVRLTPGIPYVLQNCFLVTVCSSFRVYFLVSLAPVVLMGALYVSMGKSLMAGKYGLLFLLLALLCGVMLAFRHFLRRRSANTAH